MLRGNAACRPVDALPKSMRLNTQPLPCGKAPQNQLRRITLYEQTPLNYYRSTDNPQYSFRILHLI
jgi:hypothetical protein